MSDVKTEREINAKGLKKAGVLMKEMMNEIDDAAAGVAFPLPNLWKVEMIMLMQCP